MGNKLSGDIGNTFHCCFVPLLLCCPGRAQGLIAPLGGRRQIGIKPWFLAFNNITEKQIAQIYFMMTVTDFSQTDVNTCERLADEVQLVLPSYLADCRDSALLVVWRIFRSFHCRTVATFTALISLCRCCQIKRFMRPFVVEFRTPAVKATLLSLAVRGRWTRGFSLEGAVHALMGAV